MPTAAAKDKTGLDTPIEQLAGVGPARAKEFHALEVKTLGDLLEYFPRDYQFESSELSIDELRPEQIQTVRGEVVAVNYVASRPRARFEATIDDGTGKCALTWFNAAWMRTKLHPGLYIRAKGKVGYFRNIPQMINAKWEPVEPTAEKIGESTFRAIYPATGRLASEVIERVVAENIDAAVPEVEEWFENELLVKHKLMRRGEAYRKIHRPKDLREAMAARKRLIYDELMLMQLGLGISKRLRDGRLSAPVLRIDKLLDERIRKRFPFNLTNAQQNAVYEILHDLQSGRPMNRLLQGDVGSGKTIVALYAMLTAVANRMQAAILAPTEVLAEQHYLTLSNLLKESSVGIELFTNRTKRQSKGGIMKALGDGRVHLAVGTQALIQEDIEFANLGLVVVDEQHRLGVRQRAVLKGKGLSPHYLVMTATPIPRTLALSYFADFDLSVIDELPPGRQPIQTKWLKGKQGGKAYEFIRSQVEEGRQAYIVLPKIDDDGTDDSKSVIKEFDRLSKGPLNGLKLVVLHGQMSTEEKQAVMSGFRARETDVLIATTVIEVGIDVPNATVMVIDNADRFGLSQLHQLRGRVGRGSERSYCLLVTQEEVSEASAQRLESMTKSTDGFELAETDLKLRGPGQFFGTRQHGLPEFKLADLTQEMDLLGQARDDAMELLAADPKLTKSEHTALRKALRAQLGNDVELAQIG